MSDQHMIKTRRAHKKSKTGCITCKARRVKCTEERPACLRCVRSGRLCEGYMVDLMHEIRRTESAGFSHSPSSSPHSSLSPYFGGAMSPLELRSLHFFHDRTVPSLAGFFESNLWQRLLLQISVTEPGLRHAMIAVGFLQKLSELHGLPALDYEQAPAARLDRHDAFAVNQYMKAVALIRGRLGSGDPGSIITLVACILFVCLEFLRGERKAAFIHLKSGLDIIKGRIEESERSHSSAVVPSHARTLNETDLAPMFARMSLLSTLYRQPKADPFVGMLDLDCKLQPEAVGFETLEQARMASINEMNATIRFCWMVISKQFPGEDTIRVGRAEIEARLEAWSEAFEPFLSVAQFKEPSTYTGAMRGPAVLRVHNAMAMIWTKVVKCPQDEWAYDFMLDDFISIVDASEAIIRLTNDAESAQKGHPATFSLDHGIIPPLFFAAVKCREPLVRRKAIEQLYRAPRREGAWDAVFAAKIAEVHVSIEEEPVPQPSNEDWAPLSSRVVDFDVRRREPESPNRQLVILRMVLRNGQEIGERREQYLYYEEGSMQNTPYSDRKMKEAIYKDPISVFDSPSSSHDNVSDA